MICHKCQEPPTFKTSGPVEVQVTMAPPAPPSDPVRHPSHYSARDGSSIECIDAIRAMLGPEGFTAYCLGCAMKYQWRAGRKTADGKEDLAKARQYLEFAGKGA